MEGSFDEKLQEVVELYFQGYTVSQALKKVRMNQTSIKKALCKGQK